MAELNCVCVACRVSSCCRNRRWVTPPTSLQTRSPGQCSTPCRLLTGCFSTVSQSQRSHLCDVQLLFCSPHAVTAPRKRQTDPLWSNDQRSAEMILWWSSCVIYETSVCHQSQHKSDRVLINAAAEINHHLTVRPANTLSSESSLTEFTTWRRRTW